MPQVDVKCSVANCNYWGQGNNCTAPSIMVDIDRHGNLTTEMASELGNTHQDQATTSKETCCRTFKPKKS
ncbi:MAG TPA: DUF1540 domain-containing protein [Bacillota bacterium]|nr:DUF1540 domain-containing protein [Bacillota bacterium]